MNIYTSYYKNVARRGDEFVCVCVSMSVPKWFSWRLKFMPELYPGWDLVNAIKEGLITEEEYENAYMEKLNDLDKLEILRKLDQMSADSGGKDIVLLCWEGKTAFCHRHIIAKWLGRDVIELK